MALPLIYIHWVTELNRTSQLVHGELSFEGHFLVLIGRLVYEDDVVALQSLCNTWSSLAIPIIPIRSKFPGKTNNNRRANQCLDRVRFSLCTVYGAVQTTECTQWDKTFCDSEWGGS